MPAGITSTADPLVVALFSSKGTAHTASSRPNSRCLVGDQTGVTACSITTHRFFPSIDTASIRSVPASVVKLANNTMRPPGNTEGSLCSTSCRAASSTVNWRGSPPCAGEIHNPPLRE